MVVKKYGEVKVPGCMPKLQGCYIESRFKAKLEAKKKKTRPSTSKPCDNPAA